MARVGPGPSDELSVPAQQRRRRDEEGCPPLSAQQPGQRGEQRPVRRRVTWPRHLTAEHGQLVAEHGDLDVLLVGRGPEPEQVEQASDGAGRRSSNRSPVPPVPWRGRMRGGQRRRGRRHWGGMSARERTAAPVSSGNRSAVKVPWPLSSEGQASSAASSPPRYRGGSPRPPVSQAIPGSFDASRRGQRPKAVRPRRSSHPARKDVMVDATAIGTEAGPRVWR